MTPTKLLAVAAVGLSAAACSYSNTTTATAPPPAAVVAPAGTVVVSNSSQQACLDYGFTPGTASYDRCVRLEADARARGRASRATLPRRSAISRPRLSTPASIWASFAAE